MKQESKGKYLLKNTLLFTIGSLGTRFISLFLVPLYTGVLSTSEYGIIDLVSTICAVLVPVISMNIGEAVMRFALDKDADQDKIMKIGWIFMGICCLLGLLTYPFFNIFDSTKDYSLLIFIYSVSMGLNQIAVCNLRGKEKILAYSISSIINSILAALLNILFLVVFKFGVVGYFGAYIISNSITCIYSLIIGNSVKSIFTKIDFKLAREMVRYSVFLIPTSLMWWITNSSDRIMVTALIGPAANGIYAISYKIPTLISSLTSVFNQAWSYSAIKESGNSDENEYSNYIYNNMFSTMIIIGAGLTMIMKPFLSIYVASAYYTAWKYTPYLLIGSIFLTLGTFLSTSYTVHKDSKGFLLSGSFGAGINIILNFILIPLVGVTGAAVSTCFSYISVYLFRLFHTRKYLIIKPFNITHIVGVLLLIIMSITMYFDLWFVQIALIMEFITILLNYRKFILSFYERSKLMILRRINKKD